MFEKSLKIIFIICFLLSGCVQDHLIRRREEVVSRESSPLRSELDVKVVSQEISGFYLISQIRNIAFVRNSLKLEEFYMHGSEENENVMAILGAVVGFGGCFGGYRYATSADCWYGGEAETEKVADGCMVSCVSSLLGAAMISEASSQGSEFTKIIPGPMRRDTICVDSIILIKQKMEIKVENSDFEKVYYTDEYGKIELKIDEILPEHIEADSVLGIVLRYYELVDTVVVRFR